MKKNNQGFTLIELIVSITLISLIMVFMFSLLSDITFEKDDEFFASKNQEIRQEMINIISKAARYNYQINDLTEYSNPLKMFKFKTTSLSASKKTYTSSDNVTSIEFGDKTNNHKLTIDKTKNQIRFLSADNYNYAWTLKQGRIDSTVCKAVPVGKIVLVECTIKIFTDNDNNTDIKTKNNSGDDITINNNNSLDDIILDFMIDLE